MHFKLFAAFVFASFATPAAAQDEFVLLLEYQTSSENVDNSGSSSSSGSQALGERVISAGDEGTEIEYYLPIDEDEIRGNAMWMFPAQVLVAHDGSKRVLNDGVMQARLDGWLELGNWTRDACSRWLFTWTAVQIRCDNSAAIEAIESYGMRPGQMAAGASIELAGADGSAILIDGGTRGDRRVLTASAPVDARFLRDQQIVAALAFAQMSGEDLPRETAESAASAIDVTGSIEVEFEIDADGLIWKRTDVTEMTVTGLEFGDEVRRSSQTVKRISKTDWDALLARSQAARD